MKNLKIVDITELLQKRIKKKKSKAKDLNLLLWEKLYQAGVDRGHFIREYCFAPEGTTWIYHKRKGQKWKWEPTLKERGWRADFAVPEKHLLIECDGSTFTGGGHTRGAAIENENYRDAMAMLAGWRMIRVTRKMIESGIAVELIRRALA